MSGCGQACGCGEATPEPGPEIVSFGCRLNIYESEVMRRQAAEAGLGDVLIVNTCAVTAEAERQAAQAIRRAARDNPDRPIIVTGCASEIAPDKFKSLPGVARIIGNTVKTQPESWGLPATPRIAVNDAAAARETALHLIDGLDGHSRAFVQVQNGCDHRCTFCVIPYGRGPSRSVALGPLVEQVGLLVDSGYNEIVLTGVDVTSYGHDLPGAPSLGGTIRRLLAAVPGLKRLRLSSLDPVEIDADLWRLVEGEDRLMPHLHLSIQAGDDLILKRMKRRHSRADALAVAARARAARPGLALGADLIAGFPTETDDQFDNTLRLVDEAGLHYLHVFPYSPRPGTPAARMPQLPGPVRKARAAALRAAGAAAESGFLDTLVGRTLPVLAERGGIGRTPQYAAVDLSGLDCVPGRIYDLAIMGRNGLRLVTR